jgi:hypothetical protein
LEGANDPVGHLQARAILSLASETLLKLNSPSKSSQQRRIQCQNYYLLCSHWRSSPCSRRFPRLHRRNRARKFALNVAKCRATAKIYAFQIVPQSVIKRARQRSRRNLRHGYLLPDPPPGHGVHRYAFQVFAFKDAPVDPTRMSRRTLIAWMKDKVLAKGCLTGTYERP